MDGCPSAPRLPHLTLTAVPSEPSSSLVKVRLLISPPFSPTSTLTRIYRPQLEQDHRATKHQRISRPSTLHESLGKLSADVSQFDSNANIAIEVTLSDASIFAPSPTNVQTGFRRAELNPASNNGTDPSTLGIKTLHFSVRKDDARPLNLSHEYQLVFLEDAKFSTNQFVLKTGTIAGQPVGQSSDLLVLQGNVNAPVVKNLFNVTFLADTWHNFALVLDFTAKCVFPQSLFYSTSTKIGANRKQYNTSALLSKLDSIGKCYECTE